MEAEREYNEKEEDILDLQEENGNIRNKYETAEVDLIQQQIQAVTKKIEHEKIKLRITDERYEQKKNLYNKLQGKPVAKTEEEKEKEHKKRIEEAREHKLEIMAKPKKMNKEEEFKLAQKKQNAKITKQENELETLTKTINETNLKIDELKFEIENLRKRKDAYHQQLVSFNQLNEEMEKEQIKLQEINAQNEEKIKSTDMEDLQKEKDKGMKQDKEFNNKRDFLENQYHKIIEANIQRQREKIKEQAKKRQMIGALARQIIKKESNGETDEIDEQIKKMKDEEISDRIPILDITLNDWLQNIKRKKFILQEFKKKADTARKAFDNIKNIIRVKEYNELPIIYRKTEEQMASVAKYFCDLNNEKGEKEEKKKILTEQIVLLKEKKQEIKVDKNTFNKNKDDNILSLKEKIKELEENISKKRKFFSMLQPICDKFLNKLNSTYVAEYVPNKVPLLDIKYNENNIKQIFDNISNYYKLITELEKSLKPTKDNKNDSMNKELDRLQFDMNSKLENFKFENFLTVKNLKEDLKANRDFENTIKNWAQTMANQANGEESATTRNRTKKKETAKEVIQN